MDWCSLVPRLSLVLCLLAIIIILTVHVPVASFIIIIIHYIIILSLCVLSFYGLRFRSLPFNFYCLHVVYYYYEASYMYSRYNNDSEQT